MSQKTIAFWAMICCYFAAMADIDESAQVPAVQGVEAAQAAVFRQHLQVFLFFTLCRLSSPNVTVHFASSACFSCCVFILLLRLLLHVCRLRAFFPSWHVLYFVSPVLYLLLACTRLCSAGM